jgi:DNA-binding NarL/FixJ family response regulator
MQLNALLRSGFRQPVALTMDLLSRFPEGQKNYISAASWFFSSDIRPSVGFASSRRMLLHGFYQTSINRKRIQFMVTSQREAMACLAESPPGVLVVTPHLEEGNALALLQEARALVRDLRTVVICDQDTDDLLEASSSNADAVMTEQDLLQDTQPFKSMVIALALGRRYRSPLIQAALACSSGMEGKDWRDAPPQLTSREQELVDLWVQGLGDREVADRLGVSYATVRSYGKTVRRKLGVASRAQVVLKVLNLGVSRVTGRS